MFKVETAKKIHVVYKNPIEKEVKSNACGCSGVDGVYINAEGDKKPSGFDLTGGKGFGGLLADAKKANDASNPYTGSGSTSSGTTTKDRKFWDAFLKGYDKVKNTQGAEIAKRAAVEFYNKQRGLGNNPPSYVTDSIPLDADKKKITTLGWVGIGVGALALIGLVVYVVKKNN